MRRASTVREDLSFQSVNMAAGPLFVNTYLRGGTDSCEE
jgi:hypothetical protein